MERIFLDYQITVWERVEITSPDDETIEKIKKMLAKRKSANDIIIELGLHDNNYQYLIDTASEIDLGENSYETTVELLDDKENKIAENGRPKPEPAANLREFLEREADDSLQRLWVKAHQFAKTESGDESIEMRLRYDAIKEELIAAIIEQVEFNLPSDED